MTEPWCTTWTMVFMVPSTAFCTITRMSCQLCTRYGDESIRFLFVFDGVSSLRPTCNPWSLTETQAWRAHVPMQYLGPDLWWAGPHCGAVQPAWHAGGRLAAVWEHGCLHCSRILHLQWLPETRYPLHHVPHSLVSRIWEPILIHFSASLTALLMFECFCQSRPFNELVKKTYWYQNQRMNRFDT